MVTAGWLLVLLIFGAEDFSQMFMTIFHKLEYETANHSVFISIS